MKLDRKLALELIATCDLGAKCEICRSNRQMIAEGVRAAIIECAAIAGQYAADSNDGTQQVKTARAIRKAILRLAQVRRK